MTLPTTVVVIDPERLIATVRLYRLGQRCLLLLLLPIGPARGCNVKRRSGRFMVQPGGTTGRQHEMVQQEVNDRNDACTDRERLEGDDQIVNLRPHTDQCADKAPETEVKDDGQRLAGGDDTAWHNVAHVEHDRQPRQAERYRVQEVDDDTPPADLRRGEQRKAEDERRDGGNQDV